MSIEAFRKQPVFDPEIATGNSRCMQEKQLEVFSPHLTDEDLFKKLEHDFTDKFGELKEAAIVDPDDVSYGSTYASIDGRLGTIFKIYRSPKCVALDVVLEQDGHEVRWELPTPVKNKEVFVGFVPDVQIGDKYAIQPWGVGIEFNEERRSIDPHAFALDGDISYDINGRLVLPKCVVVNRNYDWEGLDKPTVRHKDGEYVIQECHVRAATLNMPGISEKKAGTFAALGSDKYIQTLTEQGINVVELMPIQHFAVNERFFSDRRKQKEVNGIHIENVWGYSTLAFNAPHFAYSSESEPGAQVKEFKDMVKSLHRAGISVVLDVVYNHTNETDDSADNSSFRANGWKIYRDGNNTGCGPDTDLTKRDFRKFVLDSLEYWVVEMGVDGFRFDLAESLVREGYYGEHANHNGVFMQELRKKVAELEKKTQKHIFIAFEGWDCGSFEPDKFCDSGHSWSASFRDTVRDFIRDKADVERIATAVNGEMYPYQNPKILPINFVSAHDGFTSEDLVSYNVKHNEMNGEYNRDGSNDNKSWNHGIEGPTLISEVLNARERSKRAAITLQAISKGIPMLLYGDEYSRTQRGNNNAFCQPELICTDWGRNDERIKRAYEFRKEVIKFRQNSSTLQRTKPLSTDPRGVDGKPKPFAYDPELTYLTGDGRNMQDQEWSHHRVLGIYRSGIPNPESNEENGDTIISYINTSNDDHMVRLPQAFPYAGSYEMVVDSATGVVRNEPEIMFKTEFVTTERGLVKVIKQSRDVISGGEETMVERISIVSLRRISSGLKNAQSNIEPKRLLGLHVSQILNSNQLRNAA